MNFTFSFKNSWSLLSSKWSWDFHTGLKEWIENVRWVHPELVGAVQANVSDLQGEP